MSELPEPLTPPDCDLRDYEWMPIDINRLLTSETWILGSADECKAALTLWCEAWRQLPAASLPDDDRMLAHLSRVGSGWKRIRDAVMRSWIKCADGRLYHPVVAEKARESWALKLGQKQRTRAATEARKNKKHNVTPNDEPTTLQRDDNATSNVTCDVTSTSRRTLRSPPDQTRPEQNNISPSLRSVESAPTTEPPVEPKPANAEKRGQRLPSDWQPNAADRAFAAGVGLDVPSISAKFCDYWHAASGQNARKNDWSATWRNWCRREAENRSRAPKITGVITVKPNHWGEQRRQIDALFGPEPDAAPIYPEEAIYAH